MKDLITIQIAGQIVRFGSGNSSHDQHAVILGRIQEQGWERVYLDRRIHGPHNADSSQQWEIGGAYTTVLSRPIQPAS
jgi:hypothetical protein